MFQNSIGELAALGTALCWTMIGIVFERAGKKVGSLAVGYIRLVMGFLFISTYALFTRGMFLPLDASSTNWTWLSISGFIGFFLGDMFLFQSYLEVGVRVSCLIMALSPPITAILELIFLNEKLSGLSVLGMIITVLGVAIVILSKDEGENNVKINHPAKGLTYAFLGSFGQALGLILSKIGMGDYDVIAATQIRIIAGFIGFNLLFIIMKKYGDLKIAIKNKEAMKEITFGAFFGPFVGVVLSLLSLKYTTAGISSTISSITPITIIPFSIFLFKEKIKPKEILGAVMSVVGVAILFI